MTQGMRTAGRPDGAAARRSGPRTRFDRAAERLLHALRPHRARRLAPNERRVDAAAAALFLVVAAGLAAFVPSDRALPPLTAAVLVVAYALASRVRLYVGAGFAMPTQLVLVPMLFWLPPADVPLLAACSMVVVAAIDIVPGRAHAERILTRIADAWYVLGPAVVLVLAGEPSARDVSWLVVALALVAQFLLDLGASSVREWLCRGIPPGLHLRVFAQVAMIDACLTPVAVVVAGAGGVLDPDAVVAIVPLLVLLAGFAHDRRARIDELTTRIDELREERRRHDASIRRVGEASGAGLDRPALLEVVLRTAMEALGADRGRARAAGSDTEAGGDAPAPNAALEHAMDAAEARACETRRAATEARGESFAVAHPLTRESGIAGARDVVVLGRDGRAFSAEEQALAGYLAAQMSVAMENVDLHERLSREARMDELTGLANHRQFQEVLASEIERMRRFRRSLSLVMIDIDHFKAVNDTHGHQQGDEVLRHVAAAIRRISRATDTAARYGGEELAVILPDTDLDGAYTAGEQLRRAVEGVRVPRPGGAPLGVTVSVGVAAVSSAEAGGAALIAAADAALYEGKRGGRNRTVRASGGAPARFARPSG